MTSTTKATSPPTTPKPKPAPTNPPPTNPPSTAPPTVPPPTYPGHQKGDVVADKDGILQVSGYQVAASGWARIPDAQTICAPVAIRNGTSSSESYGEDQWQMQTPNGQVVRSSLLESTLGFGTIISRGTAAENV